MSRSARSIILIILGFILLLPSCRKEPLTVDPDFFGTWRIDRVDSENYRDGILVTTFNCYDCGAFYFYDNGNGERTGDLGYASFQWGSNGGYLSFIITGSTGTRREDWSITINSPDLKELYLSNFYIVNDPLYGDVEYEDRIYMTLVRI